MAILFFSSVISTEACAVAEKRPDLVIKSFQVPVGQLYYLALKPDCIELCKAHINFEIEQVFENHTQYGSFMAFSLSSENMNENVSIYFSFDKDSAQYLSFIKKGDGETSKQMHLFETDLSASIFEFEVSWDKQSISFTPYAKKTGEGWFMFSKTDDKITVPLDFTPSVYAYRATGVAGKHGIYVKEQNLVNLQ